MGRSENASAELTTPGLSFIHGDPPSKSSSFTECRGSSGAGGAGSREKKQPFAVNCCYSYLSH